MQRWGLMHLIASDAEAYFERSSARLKQQIIHLQMQETQEIQVESLSQEDSLEEEMAIHSGVFPGKSHGAGQATIHRVAKSQT